MTKPEAKLEPVNETSGIVRHAREGSLCAEKKWSSVLEENCEILGKIEFREAIGGFMAKLMFLVLIILLVFSNAFGGQAMKGLEASGPLPALADKMALFGQFVGDWEAEVVIYDPDGSKVTGKAEWHWGWILEGRALQDVYVLRSTAEKEASRVIGIGTAIRFPETETDDWRVVYVGPLKGYLYTFSARKIGDDIVLEGKNEDGAPM